MKKKLIVSILLLVFSTVSLVAVVWGWFTEGSTFRDFLITTGNVESEAKLYYLEDFDQDGILDIVDGSPIATLVSSPNLVDIKPGDVYNYRIDIKNTGTLAGDVTVYFAGLADYATVFTVEGRIADKDGNTLSTTPKKGAKNNDPFATLSNVPPARTITPEPAFQLSVYLTIKFETLDYLKVADPDVFGTLENLNYYKNSSFENAKIIVMLMQHIEASEP